MGVNSTMKCLRWFVFGFNLFFWIVGLGILGVSLWLLFDPDVSNYMSVNGDLKQFYTSVYILLAVGIIFSLLGFLGCCGALRESQFLLVAFFILLAVIFVLELICATLAFTHQMEVRQYIEKSMYDTVYAHYHRSNRFTEMFDKLQTSLECCGVHTYKDWLHSFFATQMHFEHAEIGVPASGYGAVPKSCCNAHGLLEYPGKRISLPDGTERSVECGVSFDRAPLWTYSDYLHEKYQSIHFYVLPWVNKPTYVAVIYNIEGCSDALYAKFYRNLDIVIVVAVLVGILQLAGMIASMLLCCWVNHRNEKDRKTGGYY